MDTNQMIFVILAGTVGGLINALLTGTLEFPRRETDVDDNFIGIRPGALGNIIVGGATSFVLWSLNIYTDSEPTVYGIAVLAGIGGAWVLDGILRSQFAGFERRDQLEEFAHLAELLESLIGSPAEEEETTDEQ